MDDGQRRNNYLSNSFLYEYSGWQDIVSVGLYIIIYFVSDYIADKQHIFH